MKLEWLIRVLSCGIVWLAAGTPGIAQIPATVGPLEQTLIASERSLIEAKKKDDAVFFRRTLSPDFALVGIDGKLLQKQAAVEDLGNSRLLELSPYDMKVVAVSPDVAIVTYNAVVREAPSEDEGPPPRYQHFSSVWVQHDNQWKLKFHQATAEHWGDW
jgi:hypothetical protein